MKKLIALIALVVLCGSLTFAGSTPTNNNGGTRPYDNNGGKHGTAGFTSTLINPLILTNTTNGQTLGTFVVNAAQAYSLATPTNWPANGDPIVTWTVTGEVGQRYSVRVKDMLDPGSYDGKGNANISYTGQWYYDLGYLSGYPAVHTPWAGLTQGIWSKGGFSLIQDPTTVHYTPDLYTFELTSVTALLHGTGNIDLNIEVSYNQY